MDLHRVSRIVFLGLAVTGLCLARHPVIIINGDPPDPVSITGPTFSFVADGGGGGDLSYINDTDQTWFSLNVFFNLPDLETITYVPGPFLSDTPSITNAPNGSFDYNVLFGPAPGAIAPGENFSIDLSGWPANLQFNAAVNGYDAPEPATWGLCGLAFAGALLWGWRRRYFGPNSAAKA